MLRELLVKNFAVIDELTVNFEPGLNIISGETGAGKSVIITALELALGGRASSEYVRTGEREMIVEAGFLVGSKSLSNKLKRYGIDSDDVLILKRRISRQGKSACYANGSMINLAILNDIGQELVDIHGQHQHQLLMLADNHIDFLDNYGNLITIRDNLSELFAEWQSVLKQQFKLQEKKQQQAMKQELAVFQAQEIEQANLQEGEDALLRTELEKLLNAEKILENGQWAYQSLYAAEGSVSEVISQVKSKIQELSGFDTDLEGLVENTQSLMYQVEDIACSINGYLENIEYDHVRIQEIEDRLNLIDGLKKKYGPTIASILDFYGQINTELEDFSNIDGELKAIAKRLNELTQELCDISEDLSNKRRKIALSLENKMEKQLAELGMPQSVFKVEFTQVYSDNVSYSGNDQGLEEVQFLFSANPGESPKPLVKVASGGELSRIMLALKSLLAGRDRVGSLVFDEVDTGIGGKIAEVVGKKLKQTAEFQQVICITHLPQIAALAQYHYTVSKIINNGQTFTKISCLNHDERIKEVARMLAGVEITSAALTHAEKMIGV